MQLKDFIGKIVISTQTKDRFYLHEITAPEIRVLSLKRRPDGYRDSYLFKTVNGDPFSTGRLIFEDASLTQPFLKAYDEHCRSEDGYFELYEYWMRRD